MRFGVAPALVLVHPSPPYPPPPWTLSSSFATSSSLVSLKLAVAFCLLISINNTPPLQC